MTRFLALVAVPLLLVLGVLSPSYADVDGGDHGNLSVGDVSSWEGACAVVRIDFTTVNSPPYWNFDGTVAAPGGAIVRGIGMNEDVGYSEISLCSPRHQAGTYTVSGTVTLPDPEGGSTMVTEAYSTSFVYTVKAKATQSIAVTTTRSRAPGCPGKANAHCWRVNVVVKRAGRYWVGRQVTFQARDAVWQTLARCTTKKYGKCGWYVIVKKRGAAQFPLRVISGSTATTKPAVSRTFRLRYY